MELEYVPFFSLPGNTWAIVNVAVDTADTPSSFDGLVSTSNHVLSSEVWIKTSRPIWWCVELRSR